MNKAKVKPLDLGQYPARLPNRPLAKSAEWVAGVLAGVWVAAVLIFVFTAPTQSQIMPLVIITIVSLVLPLALIFAVLVTLRSVQALRDEAARLQASVDAMRKAFIHGQTHIDPAIQPSVARKLDAIVEQTLQTQTAVVNIAAKVGQKPAEVGRASGVITPPQAEPRPEEPPLALDPGPDAAGAPLPVEDFIRAMNFPDGPDDQVGFAAMRAALGHRDIAKLIRAAQDVLTLLSQDGIYMDELKHDPAAAAAWRAFARGQRGRAVATLGGVRDRSALALSVGRLRNDAIFRDAAHHFLRAFDRCLVEFEANADDADLTALAGTRTARAFMLLGRVMGTFD